MANNLVKCVHCKKSISKETAYKVGERQYFCDEQCYKSHLDRPKTKPKPKNYKPIEGSERRDLTDYIQSIYIDQGYDKHKIPWQMIMSQVSNILAEHETWSYITIQYILWYMKEIEEADLFDEESKGSIVNLVPYYGNKAEEYFKEQEELDERIDKFDFKDNVLTIKKYKPRATIKPLTFD